jgi:hypothetical protein
MTLNHRKKIKRVSMKASSCFFFLAFIVIVIIDVKASQAQEPSTSAPTPASSDTLPAPVINDEASNVRVFVDKIEVIGTIAKPQALFIIPGRDPKVDGIQIDRSFFREIFRPMEIGRFPRLSGRPSTGNIPW